MSSPTGQSLGPYEIVDRLGAGGMGEVYRARDPRLGREVAIKILPPELANDGEYRSRFEREARAASALSHPNIAHIYDVGEQEGTHYLAMELVEGETLRARLARGPLSVDEVIDCGLQMAEALEEAHTSGVIHRDIKSANAMITPKGLVKILDFGLARHDRDSSGLNSEEVTEARTRVGVVMGTVPYMSPEQALGKEVDARTDLFSLGTVLYELTTGRLPFGGDTATQTIDEIVHADPRALSEIEANVPAELERIVRRCLEKDRARRYGTASELAADLRHLQRERQVGGREPVSDSAPTRTLTNNADSTATGSRGRLALFTIVGLGLLAAAAFLVRGALDSRSVGIRSLAVLPFQNTTGDATAEYLTNGFTESLINELSRLPDLRVISRTSSFAFKNDQEDLQEIARRLDVEALLLGRLVDERGTLAISAELVDTRDQRQIWGERYSFDLDGVALVERQLAREVAHALDPESSGAASVETAGSPVDPEAYRLYLQGALYLQGTTEEMERAAEFFRQAIAREPEYALAWAGLGQSHASHAFLLSQGRDESIREARFATRKALEIDPDLAEGLAVSGMIRLYFDWDLEGAAQDLQRAVELNPGSAVAYEEYSNVLMVQKRFEEGLVIGREAKRLDPLSILPTHQLGIVYLASGLYQEAAREFEEAQQLRPGWVWGYIKRGLALVPVGRCEEALAEIERAEEILAGADNDSAASWIGWVLARCGEPERASDYLERMEDAERDRFVDPMYISIVYAGFGDVESVLDRLEESYQARSPWMHIIDIYPAWFDIDIAEQPRYREIVRRAYPKRDQGGQAEVGEGSVAADV